MVSCIYQISISGSQKTYIGSAVNFNVRKRKHISLLRKGMHPNTHLQNSYNKHGGDTSFCMEIIEVVNKQDQLIQREQYHIDKIGINNLFNISPVAGSSMGRKASKETIEKIKKNSRMMDENRKKEFSQYWKGKKRGESFGLKIAENNKKRTISFETRKKISESNKGKKLSESHKQALLNSRKGKPMSEEAKQKIREKNTGITRSEETKRRHQLNHPNKKAVQQIDAKTNEVLQTFISCAEASRVTGFGRSAINNCCIGMSKTSNGYIWRYV